MTPQELSEGLYAECEKILDEQAKIFGTTLLMNREELLKALMLAALMGVRQGNAILTGMIQGRLFLQQELSKVMKMAIGDSVRRLHETINSTPSEKVTVRKQDLYDLLEHYRRVKQHVARMEEVRNVRHPHAED